MGSCTFYSLQLRRMEIYSQRVYEDFQQKDTKLNQKIPLYYGMHLGKRALDDINYSIQL